jgi:hypothetical protein
MKIKLGFPFWKERKKERKKKERKNEGKDERRYPALKKNPLGEREKSARYQGKGILPSHVGILVDFLCVGVCHLYWCSNWLVPPESMLQWVFCL